MDTIHAGFFAFPAAHVDLANALYARWCDAVDKLADDTDVRRNELYRAVREVAVRVAECHGESAWLASTGMFTLLRSACRRERDQAVFSPKEAKSFAEAIARLEERRGMDKLVKAISGQALIKIDPAVIIQVYETFRDLLRFAVDHDLAVTWAYLRDDAEAELAEKRRREEQRRQESEARGREPAPPPRTVSPLKDYIEREHMRQFYREEARRNLDEPLWLAAVPDDRLAEIVPLLRMMSLLSLEVEEELPRDMSPYQYLEQTGVLARRARELCQAYQILDRHAVARAKLTKGGESTILGRLDNALRAWDKPKDNRTRLNRPQHSAAAAALYASLCAWEADKGGERAAVATLIGDTEVSLRMARRAYRAVKDVLRAASEHDCGFVPMYLDVDAGEASRP